MIERHVETTFCDDIRHEVSGKLSYIGVYSGVLYVPSFPVMLPKLCLAIKVVTPGNQPLKELAIRVLKDEEILQEVTIDEEQLRAVSESTEDLTEDEQKKRAQTAQFLLVFSPLQLDTACTLKVRAQTEGGELRGIGLKVELAPPANSKVHELSGI